MIQQLESKGVFIGRTQFYVWLQYAYIKDPDRRDRRDSYTDFERAVLMRLAELFHEERSINASYSSAPLKRASYRLYQEIKEGDFESYEHERD